MQGLEIKYEYLTTQSNEATLIHVADNFIPVQYMPRVHQKAPEACVRLNKKHCPNCFCYVCDVEASKCKEWELHCCADDQPRGYPVRLPAFAVT